MEWIVRRPEPGEVVRVDRGRYRHYGVCVGKDELVHFASPAGDGPDAPGEAAVRRVSLSDFARGSFVECLVLTRAERRYAYPADRVAARALEALGETGYDVLSNNCLHFANRCLYGESAGPGAPRRSALACLKR